MKVSEAVIAGAQVCYVISKPLTATLFSRGSRQLTISNCCSFKNKLNKVHVNSYSIVSLKQACRDLRFPPDTFDAHKMIFGNSFVLCFYFNLSLLIKIYVSNLKVHFESIYIGRHTQKFKLITVSIDICSDFELDLTF